MGDRCCLERGSGGASPKETSPGTLGQEGLLTNHKNLFHGESGRKNYDGAAATILG